MKQQDPSVEELYHHCCTLLQQIEQKQQVEDYVSVRLLGLALDAVSEEMAEKAEDYH